jgi:uncharacterized protein
MKIPTISEFAQYRFVRDARGNVITLPSQGMDERILLVLDCERWGLARLHIFEGAAARADKLEAFQDDLGHVAGIRSHHLSRLISWGRDAEELFYADEMQDGEPLPAYLGRTGGVPVAVACEWIAQFLEFFESVGPLPTSLMRFSTLNFEVVMNRHGRIFPVFSEFYGWTKPGAQVREHAIDWGFAQIFCSLIAGVPIRTFHRDSLPRNFDELDPALRQIILASLDEGGGDTYAAFKSAMQSGAVGASDEESRVAVPLMPVREWLRRDLENSCEGSPDYSLDPLVDPKSERYAIPAHLRGSAANMQLLPGPGAIPREGWLNQHHDATRRPGRGMMHQLQVNYIEDRDSITLIGEERVEGVDLSALTVKTGPLALAAVKTLAAAINTALDALEKQAGACAVWWLPAENVLLLTGTRSLSGSVGLMERKGPGAWSSFPLKFRLHQTLPTLKEGVNLPSKVRHLSRLPGKQYESVRRSAIALPMLWQLLTGTRFRWSRPVVASDQVPAGLAETFERFRQQLRAEPTEVAENLFLDFTKYVPVVAPLADESAPDEKTVAVVPEAKENSLEEVLKSTLYDGDFHLAPAVPELAMDPLSSADETPFVSDGEKPEDVPEPVRKRSATSVVLWALVFGVVLASVVGFSLSGWSFKRGLFRETEPSAFTIPEFRLLEGDSSDVARSQLENLLVAAGQPESLALLSLLERLDLETNRDKIQAWLKARSESGKGEEFRVLGLLATSRGDAPEISSGYFLEGAKKGDLESQFRYAVSQWSDATGLAATGTQALPLLEVAASRGHEASQELLARVKLSKNDVAGAYKWAESAARQGRASAVHLLGLFYLNGTGCEADPVEAVAHLRSAAELGDERAMFDYGRCLSEGTGVAASFPEAQRWMRIASSRGHGPALRWCLDRGIELDDEAAP